MTLNFSNTAVIKKHPSIFLAGPTYRDANYDSSWRKDAAQIFQYLRYTGVLYIPEFAPPIGFIYERHVEAEVKWEWEALSLADVILFWIPREMKRLPGFTTNVEFGRYITKKPATVVLGYPIGAPEMKYIELLYKNETNRESVHTLKEACMLATQLLPSN